MEKALSDFWKPCRIVTYSTLTMKLRSLVFAEKLETYFILPHPNQEVKLISRVKMVNGPICQVQPANAQIDIITKPRIEKTDFLTHLRYATGLYGYTEK